MDASRARCALVILSCDAYRDLWAPSLVLHRRYWPDCPYPIVLVSESVAVEDPGVRSLRVGPGLAWSDATRAALETLPHEQVLLMLEDYFLTGPVSTSTVEGLRLELVRRGAASLRLGPWPRPTAAVPGRRDLGEHERGLPFRATLRPAFWRRQALLEILVPGESPWDFERAGSVRSARLPAPFLTARAHVIPHVDVLKRGRWTPRTLAVCRREGLAIDVTTRPTLSLLQDRVRRVRARLWLMAVGPVSWRLRRRLRRLLGLSGRRERGGRGAAGPADPER